ncbi:ATP-dependent nuclease [Microbacterium lacticum]
MARPKIAAGEVGQVQVTQLANGKWRARARMRDDSGELVQLGAEGTTEADAREELLSRAKMLTTHTKAIVTAASTIQEAAEAWLPTVKVRAENGTLSWSTCENYETTVLLTLVPVCGGVALEALTVGRCDRIIQNLLAVTLAGIPDAGTIPLPGSEIAGTESDLPQDPVADARERLAAADASADADADSFYPQLFHATVLIEEPEAHLHPQLQFGLIRYLRKLVQERPDIQVIVTTHSPELAAACEPEELVIVRRNADGTSVARRMADVPLPSALKKRLFQQTRLHLDATRSSALFGDRVLVVEGVTEATLLRILGHAWAGDDELRTGFVDSLAILPLGHKVGEWPIRLLATPGHELVTRIAALADTDRRGDPLPDPSPPAWHGQLDSTSARFFWSRPTLEPSLVAGNEVIVAQAFDEAGATKPNPITAQTVDAAFRAQPGAKGEFALALARIMDASPATVAVPLHIVEMFDWLYGAPASQSDEAADPDGW